MHSSNTFAKIYGYLSFVVVLSFLLAGCYPNSSPTQLQKTPVKMTLRETYAILPTREAESNNKILLSVESGDISRSSTDSKHSSFLNLNVKFKNISATPIMIKKPVTYGYFGSLGSGNDIEIVINRQNGAPIHVAPLSNYPGSDIHGRGLPAVTISDFIQIKPGDIYTFPIHFTLPPVYYSDTGYKGDLPAGKYNLFVFYSNRLIGYKLPEVTPTVKIEADDKRFDWILDNNYEVDLNAWIGQINSEIIELNVSN
jgi:hypothetical protein